MRVLLTASLLLGLAACSREPAPLLHAGSAMPPAPDSPVAQADPASTAPAASAAAPTPGLGVRDADPARPALGAPDAAVARDDSRWVDVDPNELAGAGDPALADFQAQQRQRDAELMQRDAEEAGAIGNAPSREPAQAQYPPAEYPQSGEDPRYRADEAPDPRDDGYDYPPEERDEEFGDGAFDEPPPYDPDEDYDPALDEPYDPRDDYPRR
jgi:hypothetical protein